jgi:hypothetical protein
MCWGLFLRNESFTTFQLDEKENMQTKIQLLTLLLSCVLFTTTVPSAVSAENKTATTFPVVVKVPDDQTWKINGPKDMQLAGTGTSEVQLAPGGIYNLMVRGRGVGKFAVSPDGFVGNAARGNTSWSEVFEFSL